MSYSDDDTVYYYQIVDVSDTSASTATVHYRFIPSGTEPKTEPANWFLMDIPESSKPSKSTWLNKKLKKLGRKNKVTVGSRAGRYEKL